MERHGFITTGSSLVADTLLTAEEGEVASPEKSAPVVAQRIRSALRYIWPFASASASHSDWWPALQAAAASVPPPAADGSADAASGVDNSGSTNAATAGAGEPATGIAALPRGPDGRPVLPQGTEKDADGPSGAWLAPQRLRDDPIMQRVRMSRMEVRSRGLVALLGAWAVC